MCTHIPPFANKVNCEFYWSKAKILDRTVCSIQPLGQQFSTVVLNGKVNCRPWVTVYFALGTAVFSYFRKTCRHLIDIVDSFILNKMVKPI